MPRRKSRRKGKLSDDKKKVVHLENYRKEIEELKSAGKEQYKPKIGRRIHALEKRIKRSA